MSNFFEALGDIYDIGKSIIMFPFDVLNDTLIHDPVEEGKRLVKKEIHQRASKFAYTISINTIKNYSVLIYAWLFIILSRYIYHTYSFWALAIIVLETTMIIRLVNTAKKMIKTCGTLNPIQYVEKLIENEYKKEYAKKEEYIKAYVEITDQYNTIKRRICHADGMVWDIIINRLKVCGIFFIFYIILYAVANYIILMDINRSWYPLSATLWAISYSYNNIINNIFLIIPYSLIISYYILLETYESTSYKDLIFHIILLPIKLIMKTFNWLIYIFHISTSPK